MVAINETHQLWCGMSMSFKSQQEETNMTT